MVLSDSSHKKRVSERPKKTVISVLNTLTVLMCFHFAFTKVSHFTQLYSVVLKGLSCWIVNITIIYLDLLAIA